MFFTRINPLQSSNTNSQGQALVDGAVKIFQQDIMQGIRTVFDYILIPAAFVVLLIFILIQIASIGISKKMNSEEDMSQKGKHLFIAVIVWLALGGYSLLATDLFAMIVK